jgi:hypothetical protein
MGIRSCGEGEAGELSPPWSAGISFKLRETHVYQFLLQKHFFIVSSYPKYSRASCKNYLNDAKAKFQVNFLALPPGNLAAHLRDIPVGDHGP